jgi:hypothetical protein
MNHLRILHNGDPRNGSPHWMVHVNESGKVWGEILTDTFSRFLQDDLFKLEGIQRFFKIPPPLTQKNLTAHPHHEEIILSLVTPSGKSLCSFLLSEVPKDSELRDAVKELVEQISVLAKQSLSK